MKNRLTMIVVMRTIAVIRYATSFYELTTPPLRELRKPAAESLIKPSKINIKK
jgi:hypothetical protein